jgi:hypothetical protein
MDSKKYIDKVLDHFIRRTKIDHDKGEIIFPFTNNYTPFSFSLSPSVFSFLLFPFIEYCKKQFGLTPEEIKYVFEQYRDIIKDKIKDEQ